MGWNLTYPNQLSIIIGQSMFIFPRSLTRTPCEHVIFYNRDTGVWGKILGLSLVILEILDKTLYLMSFNRLILKKKFVAV